MSEPVPPNYYTNVIADRWLHAEIRLISFKRLTLPESSPQPTAPLELQPLSALHNEEFEAIHSSSLRTFNKIQTQLFQALYTSDEPGETLFPPRRPSNAVRSPRTCSLMLHSLRRGRSSHRSSTKGKTLHLSHSISVVYKEDTKVIPPKDVDASLSRPRAPAALSARSSRGSWYQLVHRLVARRLEQGEGEVYSDLYGEHGVVS